MDDLDDHLLDQDEMNDMFSRPIGQDMYTTDADLENGLSGKLTKEYSRWTRFSDFRISWTC